MPDINSLDPSVAALAAAVTGALERLGLPSDDPAIERPKDPDHGDWATTVALRAAKRAGRAPRELAEALAAELRGAAVPLVDAFGVPDHVLRAPIGLGAASGVDIYKEYLHAAGFDV